MSRPVELKIVFVGVPESEKNGLLYSIIGPRSSQENTVDIGFQTIPVKVNGESFKLSLWDTPGTSEHKSLGKMYYRGANLFVFVSSGAENAGSTSKCMELLNEDVVDTFIKIVVSTGGDRRNDPHNKQPNEDTNSFASRRIHELTGYNFDMEPISPSVSQSSDVYSAAFGYLIDSQDLMGLRSESCWYLNDDSHPVRRDPHAPKPRFDESVLYDLKTKLLLQPVESLEQLIQDAEMAQSIILRKSTDWTDPGSSRSIISTLDSEEYQPESIGTLYSVGGSDYSIESIEPLQEYGWVDAIYNPGVKSTERILEKSQHKYNGDFRQVRDASRLALQFETCQGIVNAIEHLHKHFPIIEFENRFAIPTALGWRDISVLVQVNVGDRFHICEIQLHHIEYAEARKRAHKHYKTLRTMLPTVCDQIAGDDSKKCQVLILDLLTSAPLQLSDLKNDADIASANGFFAFEEISNKRLLEDAEYRGKLHQNLALLASQTGSSQTGTSQAGTSQTCSIS